MQIARLGLPGCLSLNMNKEQWIAEIAARAENGCGLESSVGDHCGSDEFFCESCSDVCRLIAYVEELEEGKRVALARLEMFEARHPGEACPHVHSLRIAMERIEELENRLEVK